MVNYQERDVNVFTGVLEEYSGEEFRTTQIRQELTARGESKNEDKINQMLAVLGNEGYVDLADYNSSGYHVWEKTSEFDLETSKDLLYESSGQEELLIQPQFGEIEIVPKSSI